MKLVIRHSTTKRTLEGDLSICGSREDITKLRDALTKHLEDPDWVYGWTEIKSGVNQEPIGWND